MTHSRLRALWLALVAAVLVGSAIWWSAARRARSIELTEVRAKAAPADERTVAGQTESKANSGAGERAASNSQAVERAGVVERRISLRITDSSGSPVSGAAASWTELRSGFLDTWRGWDRQDWAAIAAATVLRSSDSRGAAHFEDGPVFASDHRAALWITHPRYAPTSIVYRPDEVRGALLVDVVLSPQPPMVVRVIDAGGQPVVGAQVEQLLAIASDATADVARPELRVLRREGATDERGELVVEAFEGMRVLRARSQGLVSRPWTGESRAQLTLALAESCALQGELRWRPGYETEGAPRITVHAERGGIARHLGTVDCSGDRWGPLEAPVVDADAYCVRLEGYGVRVREVRIPAPGAGAAVRVDFDVDPGADMWVMAVDEEGQALTAAMSIVRWEEDGGGFEVRGHSKSNGHILVRGARPGRVAVDVVCAGFQALVGVPEELPLDPPNMYQYTLRRAGSLAGRVTASGRPVQDFDVFVSPANVPHSRVRHSFREREDGRFRIDDAPRGRVEVLAASERSPTSEAVQVEISEQAVAEVELELRDCAWARGVVIDADTGAPLRDAWVQPHTNAVYRVVAPWGRPHPVDAEGRFDQVTVPVGRAVLRIGAPDRASVWADGFATLGQPLDFGSLALGPPRRMRIELEGPADLDFTKFEVMGVSPSEITSRRFPSTGMLEYSDLTKGAQSFLVRNDDGLVISVRVEPRAFDLVRIPVGGPARLTVELAEELRTQAPPGSYVHLLLASLGPLSLRPSTEKIVDGVAALDGVPPGRWSVQLVSVASHEPLAEAFVDVPAGASEVRIRLERPAESWRLRVTDRSGTPVVNAGVQVYESAPGAAAWGARTDESGWCTLVGPQSGEYRAGVIHTMLGTRFDIPVRLRSQEELALELDARGGLHLRIVDLGAPIAGVGAELFEPSGRISLLSRTSDTQGMVRWDSYARGAYMVRIGGPGIWPIERVLHVGDEVLAADVDVRRLGQAQLTLRDARGLLLPGVAVEISCDELEDHPRGALVRNWVTAGLVRASSPGLVTDDQGRLELQGLPRGRYRVRCSAPALDVRRDIFGARSEHFEVSSEY